jgi:hypothetical protein
VYPVLCWQLDDACWSQSNTSGREFQVAALLISDRQPTSGFKLFVVVRAIIFSSWLAYFSSRELLFAGMRVKIEIS